MAFVAYVIAVTVVVASALVVATRERWSPLVVGIAYGLIITAAAVGLAIGASITIQHIT